MTRWFDRVIASTDLSTAVLEAAIDSNNTSHDHTAPDPTPRAEQLVTLAELVAEAFGSGSVETLAAQLPAAEVLVDDIGRRCVTRDTARRLFTERHEAEVIAARRDAERRAVRAREREEGRERRRAERARASHRPKAVDGLTPLQVMKVNDPEHCEQALRRDRDRLEMLTGESGYHRIQRDDIDTTIHESAPLRSRVTRYELDVTDEHGNPVTGI